MPQFEAVSPKDKVASKPARLYLDALERLITTQAVANSRFRRSSMKRTSSGLLEVDEPPSFRGRIVSEEVLELRRTRI